MNVLVTGANGQLGMEMRNAASESNNNYIFTDIAELDITNAEAVNKAMIDNKINVVVNCAAYTNVDKAEDDFATADLLNNKAVKILAEAVKDHDATLIHISTDYVFDGTKGAPYLPDDKTNPDIPSFLCQAWNTLFEDKD